MMYGVTRRPWRERYFHKTPSDELSHEWMVSVLGMVDAVLCSPGTLTLQDIADALDYGPHTLSPRLREQVRQIAGAFKYSIEKQLAECRKGNHRFVGCKCWYCDEPKLQVVKDE